MRTFRWALIQYDWCPYEKGKFGQRQAHLHVKMEAEMHKPSNTKDCQHSTRS